MASALLVTMGVDYVAPARLPRELKRQGFRVGVLAPDGALALATGFADERRRFPGNATLLEWIATLARMIDSFQPDILLPGDDVAMLALMQSATTSGPGLAPLLDTGLRNLIVRSLGDPAHWFEAVDKTRLFEHAKAAGLAVVDGGVAYSAAKAVAIAADLGYPVILRPGFGTAGRGTARCNDPQAVRAAFLAAAASPSGLPELARRCLVQRWHTGPVATRAALAWRGSEVAGFTRTRLATYPDAFGPGSVVQFVGNPAVADATRRLCANLGLHGLLGTQFLLDEESGEALLVELNLRMLQATHSGALVGIDLAAALAAMIHGKKWLGPTDLPAGPGMRLALFPQEWYREPESRWLQQLPCDVPWDDPPLLAALVRSATQGDGSTRQPAPGSGAGTLKPGVIR